MNFLCKLGVHNWQGCECHSCNKTRHSWRQLTNLDLNEFDILSGKHENIWKLCTLCGHKQIDWERTLIGNHPIPSPDKLFTGHKTAYTKIGPIITGLVFFVLIFYLSYFVFFKQSDVSYIYNEKSSISTKIGAYYIVSANQKFIGNISNYLPAYLIPSSSLKEELLHEISVKVIDNACYRIDNTISLSLSESSVGWNKEQYDKKTYQYTAEGYAISLSVEGIWNGVCRETLLTVINDSEYTLSDGKKNYNKGEVLKNIKLIFGIKEILISGFIPFFVSVATSIIVATIGWFVASAME